MADLAMGAMGSLVPKLGELLKEEYKLQTGVKDRIRFLTQELEAAQAALRKVAEVPWDQLDEQVKLWAREVREASYDMEDVLDTFLVRVQGPAGSAEQEKNLLKSLKKMANLVKTMKLRRKISGDVVKDIMARIQEVTERRRRRYAVDDIMAKPATSSTVDPRLDAISNKVMRNLVGIDESIDEFIYMLQSPQPDDASNTTVKIVSLVGVCGLGKTTLAKAVYDELKGDFDCGAFVHVGRNPDLNKVSKDILIHLDRQRYLQTVLDTRLLIDELRSFLANKRYLLVIDDIWEIESWETIKLAIDDDHNCGGRVMITTRKWEVATKADEVYNLQPLPYNSSRELFYTRIYGERGWADNQPGVANEPDDITNKIISKCGGIPLTIITIASLLCNKPKEKWLEVYNSIGFGHEDNTEAEKTKRILSLVYHDLPSHLRACLLYLSAFPEDYVISKDSLIWMWIAEGFVQQKQGIRLFETGEGYFDDLVTRSMIQAVHSDYDDDSIIDGCRVHNNMLLHDFIHSMSCEENFFTVLDNSQGTVPHSNVRRLGHHNMTLGQIHKANHFDTPKVRSFIAIGCVIEGWAPLYSFKLVRVVAIENCRRMDDQRICIDYVGHLVHLRFLSLRGTRIGNKVLDNIGGLRFLETLDLWGSDILDLSWSRHILVVNQLVCLRITFDGDAAADQDELFPVERLTSLEELSIHWSGNKTAIRWHVKELGRLSQLRKLNARILCDDQETERGLVESLGYLHRLQHLRIEVFHPGCHPPPTCCRWQAADLLLPRHLRHLAVSGVNFTKLPSCINPSGLPNLSHLDLSVEYADEQDMKILGGLPELRFLALSLPFLVMQNTFHGVVIAAGAFPKLLYCYMGPLLLTFQPDAMPCLECYKLDVIVRYLMDDSDLGFHHFDSLGYIRSLQKVHAMIDLRGANTQEAEKVESALRPLVQSHANRPTLTLERVGTCVDHDKILSEKLDHYSPVAPGVMPLELLRAITNDFSEERVIGRGAFGTVYKGVQDNGREVAVKLLHSRLQRLDYEEEFKEELEKLRRLNHPNIVQLLGYCYEVKDKCVQYNGTLIVAEEIYRALCFEFMHHGSLQGHLEDEFHVLDWQTRYTIIKGTCEGLKYLHEGLESPMYHLDLKPSNILLDKNMVPKLADFGLSKLVCDSEDQSTLSFLGPVIYCPPEYIDQKYVSNKLDIFSLGVIMIQIIAGSGGYYETAEMPPKEFIHHVEENWRKRLQATPGCTLLKYECHQVKRCIEIAMDCIQADRRRRPNVGDITSWLSETEKSAITFTSQNDDDDKADGEDEIKFFGTEQTDFTDQEGEMRCTLSVIEAPTGSSLGAMGPLLRTLDLLLSSKNQLRSSVNEAIKLLREDLKEIVADLLRLSMVERPNYKIRYWMHEVRELSYHIEDCINNMMRSRTTVKAKVMISGRRPQFRVRRVEIPWLPKTVLPSERITELRTLLWEASERHERYHLQDCVSEPTRFLFSGNSKAPASSGAAARLVGVDGTKGKLTSWLSIDQTEAEQQQLKVLSILGPSGVGKTALVRELYRELGHQFERLAFVRVSRNPDIKRLLGEILSQLQGRKRDYNACTVDNLLDTFRSHLQDKRYFVVIDELWEAAVWDIINIAFPKGNNCSRIIITAEGKDVKCYRVNTLEMTPLASLQDSEKIFFDRVFGSEHQCPEELKDISCTIISSCGGFPLAITTIASLLASQVDNTELWRYIQQCFLSRLTSLTLEETCKEVVNICYDAMPQDLKTCLLYLAMYPEGCRIRKVDLLNQWIAEGFISPKEGEQQAVAESYFAELINRGMIQPEKIEHNEVLSCTVHHIVFDLIVKRSKEENFITAVDYSQPMPGFSMTTRRLSLHFSCAQFADKPEGINLSQVRSLAFYGLLKCMPSITEFKFLRILILEFWGHDSDHTSLDLSKLCMLFQLRYLKIISSPIVIVLPSQIRRLQSLETLDIDAQVSLLLPSKALSDRPLKRNLVLLSSSLRRLPNLKSLRLGPCTVGMTMFVDHDGISCTPGLLERLDILQSGCIFSRLPTWIVGLTKLRILKIAVRVLLSSDIDTLTGLPALVVLSLYVQKPANAEGVVFNSGTLPALKYFKYKCDALHLAFEKEALPNVQRLKLCFNVHRAESYTSRLAGIEHLLKLKEITAEIGAAAGADESDRSAAESELQEATKKHPRSSIHMNVKRVDCIEEESTPVTFMHHIHYILGFLVLAVVVFIMFFSFWY